MRWRSVSSTMRSRRLVTMWTLSARSGLPLSFVSHRRSEGSPMYVPGLLKTYLQDHHAGATVGLELARRAAGSNEDNEYGPELRRIADEIGEDRETLEQVMERLEIKP